MACIPAVRGTGDFLSAFDDPLMGESESWQI